jgi:RNA polymerase sigma factor (sigma-70 family)
MSQTSVSALVQRAAAHEEQAWRDLVERYSPLLWSVTRSFGLPQQRAGDVVQTAWLRLVQHIGGLRDPEHVGAWLATTARREAMRAVASGRREDLQDESSWDRADVSQEPPDAGILRHEQHDRLETALAALPPRQEQLLRILSTDPAPSYREVAAATGMPIGSIGPTRARALDRLRSLLTDDFGPQAGADAGATLSRAGGR